MRANLATIDAQADQFTGFAQRLDLLAGQQAVTGQLGQACDQAGHVQHQLVEPIDLALELRIAQRWRQLIALDRIDPRAHGLAGEEAGQIAGQGARRPQVMRIGKQTHTAQIQLAIAGQRFAPAPWHIADGLGRAGQRAMQSVLGAAMNDPLRLHALPAAQARRLHQERGEALATQTGIEPEAGDTAADDQDIGAESLGHERASKKNRGAV